MPNIERIFIYRKNSGNQAEELLKYSTIITFNLVIKISRKHRRSMYLKFRLSKIYFLTWLNQR